MSNLFAGYEHFVDSVTNLFKSHSPKRPRSDGGGNTPANPFPEAETQWLTETMDSTMRHFGTAVDGRFKRNESVINNHQERLNFLEAKMASLEIGAAQSSTQIAGMVTQHVFEAAVVKIGEEQ